MIKLKRVKSGDTCKGCYFDNNRNCTRPYSLSESEYEKNMSCGTNDFIYKEVKPLSPYVKLTQLSIKIEKHISKPNIPNSDLWLFEHIQNVIKEVLKDEGSRIC